MAMLNFMETSIPELYSRGLFDVKGYDLGAAQADKMAAIFFTGVSNALKDVKSKEHPVAFVFDEPNMDLNAAAIVRHIPAETDDMPGHWNYVWTFYKTDIPEDARILRLKDTDFQVYFRTIAAQKFVMGFRTPAALVECGNFLMKQISQWLTDNAKPEEEVGVVLDGIFQARAAVEDNEIVKSIEVIGETKAIIKDDAGEEV
jgi:hypothetical protein